MKDCTTTSCARALLSWISTYGTPSEITSDRGRQFISRLWQQLKKFIGANINKITAFHPQYNSIDERFHRKLKASLKAKLLNNNWNDALPLIMLGIRATPKEDIDCSSTELAFGTTLHLPGEFFDTIKSKLRENKKRLKPKQTSSHGNNPTNKVPPIILSAKYFSYEMAHIDHRYKEFMMDLIE